MTFVQPEMQSEPEARAMAIALGLPAEFFEEDQDDEPPVPVK